MFVDTSALDLAHSQEETQCGKRRLAQSQSRASHCWLCSVRRTKRWHRMPRHLIRTWPRSSSISWTELPRSRWHAVQHRSPFQAMQRSWFLVVMVSRQRSKAKTVSCVPWNVRGLPHPILTFLIRKCGSRNVLTRRPRVPTFYATSHGYELNPVLSWSSQKSSKALTFSY